VTLCTSDAFIQILCQFLHSQTIKWKITQISDWDFRLQLHGQQARSLLLHRLQATGLANIKMVEAGQYPGLKEKLDGEYYEMLQLHGRRRIEYKHVCLNSN
jgi:hypothetical protein